jgi:predicted Zn finger-like uncharacterized protein
MTFKDLENSAFGGDVFGKCPNCGSDKIEDQYHGMAGQKVYCRNCNSLFKRRGALEKFTDQKIAQANAWAWQRTWKNLTLPFRKPLLFCLCLAWMVFLLIWIGVSVQRRADSNWLVLFASGIAVVALGTFLLAIPSALSIAYLHWLKMRREGAGTWQDLMNGDRKLLYGALGACAALSIAKSLL